MNLFLSSFGRALVSQLHIRMLLLTVLPFLVSILLWGVLLWLGLQPLMDALQSWFADNSLFRWSGDLLTQVGLDKLKPVLVPLLAMWLLLPLMIVTALLFVGVIAMPAILRHLSRRQYAAVQKRQGGSLLGGVVVSTLAFVVFIVLWLATLPLNAIPPMMFVVQPLLWGWLTYRVMAYDALSEHADNDERKLLLRRYRWPLLAIGISTGAMGAVPSMLWLTGALSVIFFPLLAAISIWLYVIVFVFSGLWFSHFCLEALARERRRVDAQPAVQPAVQPNAHPSPHSPSQLPGQSLDRISESDPPSASGGTTRDIN